MSKKNLFIWDSVANRWYYMEGTLFKWTNYYNGKKTKTLQVRLR